MTTKPSIETILREKFTKNVDFERYLSFCGRLRVLTFVRILASGDTKIKTLVSNNLTCFFYLHKESGTQYGVNLLSESFYLLFSKEKRKNL